MAERDVVFDAPARRFLYRTATSAERSAILRIIDELADAPEPDERRKFDTRQGDLLFHDGRFLVLYEVVNDFLIAIRGIGTAD
jgi:hypothetical protein